MTKQCCVCGKEFETNRSNQVTCGDAECKREQHRRYLQGYARKYREKHRYEINRRNAEYMRRARSEEKLRSECNLFTADDYAEKQRQKTLAMVGKVQI